MAPGGQVKLLGGQFEPEMARGGLEAIDFLRWSSSNPALPEVAAGV
jgi:hypothetical protein